MAPSPQLSPLPQAIRNSSRVEHHLRGCAVPIFSRATKQLRNYAKHRKNNFSHQEGLW